MPRVGMNPNRLMPFKGKLPPEVPVISMITHLPDTKGYHANRLEIVMASLESMKKHAGADNFLIVYDNGSIPQLQEWILDEIRPDMFVHTANVGKVNAMRFILCAAGSGALVSISDDDMLFYPDWLAPQVRIMRTFSRVGAVSGCTTTRLGYNAIEYTKAWAKAGQVINSKEITWDERPIPIQWDIDHIRSIGEAHDDEGARKAIHGKIGFHIEYNGVKCWAGGGHCQFMGYTDTLMQFMPKPAPRLMQPLFPLLDVSMDSDGYLRLMTEERGCRHLGNVLTEADRLEIEAMGL